MTDLYHPSDWRLAARKTQGNDKVQRNAIARLLFWGVGLLLQLQQQLANRCKRVAPLRKLLQVYGETRGPTPTSKKRFWCRTQCAYNKRARNSQ